MKAIPKKVTVNGLTSALVAVALAAANAPAQSINVSFEHASDSSPAPAALEGPAGGLGETWNQLSGSSGSDLLDTVGTTSAVGYRSTNLGGPDKWGEPGLGVIWSGLRNFDTNPGNSQQFVITGLTPGNLYEVWIASANTLDFARSGGEWSTPNATISASPQVVSNVFSGVNGATWEEGNNFVIFENIEADGSGELVFNGFSYHKDSVEGGGDGTPGSSTHDPRLPVNGFQLRPDQLAGMVDADVSRVEASPTVVEADGTATSTITVSLKDATSLSVPGKTVSLDNSAGPQMAVITPSTPQVTDVAGKAIFTVSSTTEGLEEFTATDDSDAIPLTQIASVEFEITVVGPVDAGVSTVEASPPGVLADGVSASTITVALKDINGNAVEGENVALAGSTGNAVINPATDTTDANGEVAFTVSSGTIEVEEFTATVVTSGNLAITQTASVNFIDPEAPLAINVSFEHLSQSSPDPGTLEGPAGGLGETWSQLSASSGSNLLDANGLVSGVGYGSTNLGGPDKWGEPALGVIWSGLRNFDTSPTNSQQFRITGLTAGDLYDVWIASGNTLDSQRHSGTWTTPNPTTTVGGQVATNIIAINRDTWEEGNNYVLFENVEADVNGELVFDGHSDDKSVVGYDPRLPVSGFQLRETSGPQKIALTIKRSETNPGRYDFSWKPTSNDKLYDLVSQTDLSVDLALWPVWMGNEDMDGTAPMNILENVPGGTESIRFFAVIEKNPPPPPLVNGSFEDPEIAEGSFTNTAPAGWTEFDASDLGDVGVWHPLDSEHASVPDGENAAQVYFSGIIPMAPFGLSQQLDASFAVDTGYEVTVEVGRSALFAWPGYRIELWAGATKIAEESGAAVPGADSWTPRTVSYAYAAGDAGLAGEPLEIRLLSLGEDPEGAGATAEFSVEFDNVTFTATP